MDRSRNNRLTSPMTKEEVYAFIDTYFAEGQADISVDVKPEEIRSAIAGDLNEQREAINRTGESLRSLFGAVDKAVSDAKAALQAAQRKTGGTVTVKVERKDGP